MLPDHMAKYFPVLSLRLPRTSRYVGLGSPHDVFPMSFWGLPHILLSTLSLLTPSRAEPLMSALIFGSRAWPRLLSKCVEFTLQRDVGLVTLVVRACRLCQWSLGRCGALALSVTCPCGHLQGSVSMTPKQLGIDWERQSIQ